MLGGLRGWDGYGGVFGCWEWFGDVLLFFVVRSVVSGFICSVFVEGGYVLFCMGVLGV